MTASNVILGAGVTGLAAGFVSGLPIYEALDHPGGVCSSYYMRPGSSERLLDPPANGETYRFEKGGGHWIHSRDQILLHFIQSIVPMKSYTRVSSVYFPDKDLFVPYPLQNNLRYLGPKIAANALSEMIESQCYKGPVETMADWLLVNFGPTLCKLFFHPFHELYTGGLWESISAQDSYKSPINRVLAIRGAFGESALAGYNIKFFYPEKGLNSLVRRMTVASRVNYVKRVVRIDVNHKKLIFDDDTVVRYNKLISTLPLNRVLEISKMEVNLKSDPYTSVLVLNIGAVRGSRCPKEHWVYIPKSKSGFHRVGFYSNVDGSFLPASCSTSQDRVSLYVEKAYAEQTKPTFNEINEVIKGIIRELVGWEWINEPELIDHNWIEVAYSWSWPRSCWQLQALEALQEHHIFQAGRFARWQTQGIADSIKDGIMLGSVFKAIQ